MTMIEYAKQQNGEAKESQPLELNESKNEKGTKGKDIKLQQSKKFLQSPTHIHSLFSNSIWPFRSFCTCIYRRQGRLKRIHSHRYRPYSFSHSNFFHRSPADEKRVRKNQYSYSNLITLNKLKKQKHKQTSNFNINKLSSKVNKMAEVLPIQNVVDSVTAKIHSASAIINPAGNNTTTTTTTTTIPGNPLPSTNTSNRLGRVAKQQASNTNAKSSQPVRKVR